jgi:Family of unknown function (DUF6152)
LKRLIALALVTAAVSAGAHHSTLMFEWGKERVVEGTVNEFQWTQPHGFIWLSVPGARGKVEQWGFEGMSPSWLGRHDWTRHSLEPGQKVTVTYYPLKDGRRFAGFFVRVELPGGKRLEGLPGPGRLPSLSSVTEGP